MSFRFKSRTIAAELRKLADACPLCGDLDAENGPKTTRCPNADCRNHDLERAFEVQHGVGSDPTLPPGTSEHKRPANLDFAELHISYNRCGYEELRLEEPVRAELRSLLRSADVYIIRIPEPFSHQMIPSEFKRKVSGFFTEISMNGCQVYVTDDNQQSYYASEVHQLYLLADCLTEMFSGVGKYVDSGVSKVAFGEVSRIVFSKDAGQALAVASRYQNDLPLKSIQKLQAVVLEHGTPAEAYFFAKDVKGADIKRLEAKVLDSSDLQTIYVFAKNVDGANVAAAERRIINSGNAQIIRLFSQNVDGADVAALEHALHMQRMTKKSEA